MNRCPSSSSLCEELAEEPPVFAVREVMLYLDRAAVRAGELDLLLRRGHEAVDPMPRRRRVHHPFADFFSRRGDARLVAPPGVFEIRIEHLFRVPGDERDRHLADELFEFRLL